MQGGAFRAARFPCRSRAGKVRRAAEARATANSGDDKENVQKRGRAPRFFASYFLVRLSGYRRPHSVSGRPKRRKSQKQKKTQRERHVAEAPVFSFAQREPICSYVAAGRCAAGLPTSRFIQCPNTLIRQYRCALGIAFYYVYTNTIWRHIRAERNGETICAELWSENRTEVWYMVNGKWQKDRTAAAYRRTQ